MKNYYRVRDGHLQRLVHDTVHGKQVTPRDNPPDTAWLHICEAGKCGKYRGGEMVSTG